MLLHSCIIGLCLMVVSVCGLMPFQDPSLPWDKRVDDLVCHQLILYLNVAKFQHLLEAVLF